jgi:hypothetical protein
LAALALRRPEPDSMDYFLGHIFNLTFFGPYVILPSGNVTGMDTGKDTDLFLISQ